MGGKPLAGRKVFVKKQCVRCHAVMGNGGNLGPDLAEVGKGRSFFQLLSELWSHSPQMIQSMQDRSVPWPTFADEEMRDLTAYIYFLNFLDKPGEFQKGVKWNRFGMARRRVFEVVMTDPVPWKLTGAFLTFAPGQPVKVSQ